MGKDDLTRIELQICIDFVNAVVQEEHDRKFVCVNPKPFFKNFFMAAVSQAYLAKKSASLMRCFFFLHGSVT